MPKPASPKYYVYLLRDSRSGDVFYVGKGSGRRAWSHEAPGRKGTHRNPRLSARVQTILRAGGRVLVEKLEDNLSEHAAFTRERAEIAIRANLCNLQPGVSSAYERMQLRAKQAIRRFKPFRVWIAECARTPEEVRRYWRILKGLAKEAASPTPNVYTQTPHGVVGSWEE
jgi:hypothetical protein